MHDPCDPNFTAMKRILRYVRGTIDHGLQCHVSSTAQLTAYTNADWAGCLLLADLPQVTVYSLVIICCHGLQSDMSLCLDLVLKQNIVYADIFTKALPTALFLEFRSSLNVRRPPFQLRGVGDEEVVVGEGVVVTSSSLEMLTNSYLGGIMEDEDGKKNGKEGLFNLKA
nr:ribonuclease H-like domain-containing protein [Tanacetum cinerariifolium]